MKILIIIFASLFSLSAWAYEGSFSCILLNEGTHLTTIECTADGILVDMQLNKVPAEGHCSLEDVRAEVKTMGMTVIFQAQPDADPNAPDFAEYNYMQYLGGNKTPILCTAN